jgi:SAM-dependent methyltransferase
VDRRVGQGQHCVTKRPVHGQRPLAKGVFSVCASLGLSTGEPVDHRFGKRLEWRTIHRYLGLTGQESVCDIGCADGNWTRRLGSESRLAVGLDLNWRVARWATVKTYIHGLETERRRKRFSGLAARLRPSPSHAAAEGSVTPNNGHVPPAESPPSGAKAIISRPVFLCANAQHLPFASGSFDRLASICSLEHFRDDAQALREMARVLRPGGIAALTVDSLSHPQGPSGELLEQYRSKHSIRRCYRLADMENLALNSGFEVEESRYLVNSALTNRLHLLWAKWDLQGKHADWIEALFPWAYWLALVSDSLWGRSDCGAFLAVKLRKTGSP